MKIAAVFAGAGLGAVGDVSAAKNGVVLSFFKAFVWVVIFAELNGFWIKAVVFVDEIAEVFAKEGQLLLFAIIGGRNRCLTSWVGFRVVDLKDANGNATDDDGGRAN